MPNFFPTRFLRWAILFAAGWSFSIAAWATTVAIPVHIWADGAAGNGLSVSGTFLESAPGANDGYETVTQPGSGSITADLGNVNAEPGRGYQVMIGGGSWFYGGALNVVPPPGFYAEIEGVVRNRYMTGYGAVVIRILPRPALAPRQASADISQATGKIDWRVSLGSLRNGASAGEIALIDAGFMSDWSALYTPALLDYEALSSEVQVYRNGGWIRQVIANETAVDVVTLSSTAYELRFYNPAQLQGTEAPYDFSGQPYTVYKIERDGGAGATKLKITRKCYNIPDTATTGLAAARTETMSIERSGTTWPNYDWTHSAWTVEGQTALVQRTVDSGGTAAARTESVAVRIPGGNIATSASRNFAVKPWGEVVTSEKLGSASTNGPTADFVYYEDALQPGSYSFLKSMTTGSGNWEAYEYFDTTLATSRREGTIKYRFKPYLDSPATASLTQGSGEVTEFDYTYDAFGFLTRPVLKQTKVNGVLTAKSTTSYNTGVANDMVVMVATTQEYADATNYLESVTRFYREDNSDSFFRGQIHSTQQPDGVKTVYAHQRGTWSGGAFTKTGSNGLGPGTASRQTMIVGSNSSAAGSPYTTHDGYDIDDLYLVDGKSTMQVTIRDSRALVVRTESHAWSGGAWQLVGFTNYSYNFVGQATGRTTSNGAIYSATYDGGLLTDQTDESGVVVSYTYDVAGRVLTATKAGGPTTTFTYDAAGRVTASVVSASGTIETIVSSQVFDDAGRVTSATSPGLPATVVTYDLVNRTVTTTAPKADGTPGGATSAQTSFRDGRLKQITGTAVVSQYFTYSLETDGRRFTQVNTGDPASLRLQKSWSDWLGRSIKSERPGFSKTPAQPSFVEQRFYEAGTGHLFKTTRTGYAPIRFVYDALGNIISSGLDVNGLTANDGLVPESADRIGESDTFIEQFNSAWWVKTISKTYPTLNSATPIITSVSRTRLTGHPANRLAETQVTDAEGNVATTTVVVDRATKTVTTTTTLPGLANAQTSIAVNGLTTSVTGNDNLTTTQQYDAFSRPWKNTDSRNNTVTTTYYPGTTFPYTVADGTDTVVQTVGYDALGRVAWSQDAGLHLTRSAYNLRGQLTHQWGDATIPVSYEYDVTYGDRIGMSTYRSAPVGDFQAWPAGSIGSPDTTTWTIDIPSALLWKKADATGKGVEFTYNDRGQVATRKWARNVTTTYAYDGTTGELTGQTYSDGTPAVSYAYNRLGQTRTISDVTGLRNFNYDPAKPWRLANETFSSDFGSLTLTRRYELSGVLGRDTGFKLGTGADSSSTLEQDYLYTATGRFDRLISQRANNTVSAAFQYNYAQPNSDLVTGYSSGANFAVVRAYETQRDILTSIDSMWSGVSQTKFEFTTNALGQRITAKQSGIAFADYYTGTYSSVFNHYTYNARGELETAAMYRGDSLPASGVLPPAANELPGRRFEFRYDSAGNRKNAGPTGDPNNIDDQYFTNALNQYTAKENNSVRVTGTVATGANVVVAGATSASKKDRAWSAEFMPANISAAAAGALTTYAALPGGGAGGADLIRTDTTKSYFIAKAAQTFAYDEDGNLTHDSVWDYTYDAENRLIAMQHRAEVIGTGMITLASARRLEFAYDYAGRRVAKIVKGGWNGTGYPTVLSYGKFIYDGWNLVAEYNGATPTNLGTLVRAYTWGLDLAGSLTAAGGVGALLQLYDAGTGKTYFPTYDGNGNVVSMLNAASGALEAVYEYNPFGELIRQEGPYVGTNPIRFSSKYTDPETGLSYYGHRYYSATLGRFINRDPIEESGGLNLYGFVGNDGVNGSDYLGCYDPHYAESMDDLFYWIPVIPQPPVISPWTLGVAPFPTEGGDVSTGPNPPVTVTPPPNPVTPQDTVPTTSPPPPPNVVAPPPALSPPPFTPDITREQNTSPDLSDFRRTAPNREVTFWGEFFDRAGDFGIRFTELAQATDEAIMQPIETARSIARTQESVIDRFNEWWSGGIYRAPLESRATYEQLRAAIAGINWDNAPDVAWALGVGWVGGEVPQIARLAGGRIGSLGRFGRVTVYRVEGLPNTRIFVGAGGRVAIIGDDPDMLFLNFGDAKQAQYWLDKRLGQNMPGAALKSFEVPRSFLEELRDAAVPQRLGRQFPDRPQIVDPTKAADQFGLQPQQIEALRRAVIQGSGKVH